MARPVIPHVCTPTGNNQCVAITMEHVPGGLWKCNRPIEGMCYIWQLSCDIHHIDRINCLLGCVNGIWYYQHDHQLVKFDGTKVVNLPKDHCSCRPKKGTYQEIHLHL